MSRGNSRAEPTMRLGSEKSSGDLGGEDAGGQTLEGPIHPLHLMLSPAAVGSREAVSKPGKSFFPQVIL